MKHLKKILCAVLFLALAVPASAAAFTGTAGHWAVNEIEACLPAGHRGRAGGGHLA